MKKICLILAILFVVACCSAVSTAFATTSIDFDNTDVLADLRSIEGFNEQSFSSYSSIRLVYFAEYCYAYNINKNVNYGLYLYVYNGSSKSIDIGNALNKVQLSTEFNTDGSTKKYGKFELRFLDSNGKFLKFKVKDARDILQTVYQYELTHNVRRYDISGIELFTLGGINAPEADVSISYFYSGYSLGYGNEVDVDDLTHHTEELETIQFDLHSTFYRPNGANFEGSGVQDQLNSVYFAVSNDVLNKYGNISAIHMEWYEYLTENMFITGNHEIYNHLENFIDVDTGSTVNTDVKYAFHTSDYLIAYNMYFKPTEPINTLRYLFSTGNMLAKDYTLTSSDLINYIVKYSNNHTKDINGKYSSNLFKSYVQEGRKIGRNDVMIYSDDVYNLINYELKEPTFIQKIFGVKKYENSPFYGIKAIVEVEKDDILYGTAEANCKKYFIDKADYSKFYETCITAIGSNKTIVISRQSVTDFVSKRVTQGELKRFVLNWNFVNTDTNAYVSQQTVFLDLDFIDVTFRSDLNEATVMACVSTPIDVINSVTPPVNDNGEKAFPWILVCIIVGVIVLLLWLIPSNHDFAKRITSLLLFALIVLIVLQFFEVINWGFLDWLISIGH